MSINPFLIVFIVMVTCCIFDSSVINLTYSEQQVFSHNICIVRKESTIKQIYTEGYFTKHVNITTIYSLHKLI